MDDILKSAWGDLLNENEKLAALLDEKDARIERLQATPVPSALHWLGDRHEGTPCAQDARGCVLYFSTQGECLQFMNWLTALKEG